MELRKTAVAGTIESSDVMVTVRPNPEKGLKIELESVVLSMFGDEIRKTVEEVVDSFGVQDAVVELQDKGAIDCVIRARVAAAICRAAETKFDWSQYDPETGKEAQNG